jgi:hypothetical protein
VVSDEPRYTLEEAEKILAKRRCDREGHAIDVVVKQSVGGPAVTVVSCGRCGVRYDERRPPETWAG